MENKNENYDDCTLPHFLLLFSSFVWSMGRTQFSIHRHQEKKNEISFFFFSIAVCFLKKKKVQNVKPESKAKKEREKR